MRDVIIGAKLFPYYVEEFEKTTDAGLKGLLAMRAIYYQALTQYRNIRG